MVMKNSSKINGSVDGGGDNDDDRCGGYTIRERQNLLT
jgi:hypothetical protein